MEDSIPKASSLANKIDGKIGSVKKKIQKMQRHIPTGSEEAIASAIAAET